MKKRPLIIILLCTNYFISAQTYEYRVSKDSVGYSEYGKKELKIKEGTVISADNNAITGFVIDEVEVQFDATDSDGNPIKPGTFGWCYGGYLE